MAIQTYIHAHAASQPQNVFTHTQNYIRSGINRYILGVQTYADTYIYLRTNSLFIFSLCYFFFCFAPNTLSTHIHTYVCIYAYNCKCAAQFATVSEYTYITALRSMWLLSFVLTYEFATIFKQYAYTSLCFRFLRALT